MESSRFFHQKASHACNLMVCCYRYTRYSGGKNARREPDGDLTTQRRRLSQNKEPETLESLRARLMTEDPDDVTINS